MPLGDQDPKTEPTRHREQTGVGARLTAMGYFGVGSSPSLEGEGFLNPDRAHVGWHIS